MTNQQREGWEEKLGVILDETIIDGGFEYNKDDSWIDEEEAKERIKSFIKETLEKELHERDKDWQKTIKGVATLERERVLNEVKSSAAEQRCRDCDERNDQCVVNSALDCVIEVITSLQENK